MRYDATIIDSGLLFVKQISGFINILQSVHVFLTPASHCILPDFVLEFVGYDKLRCLCVSFFCKGGRGNPRIYE